jgi:hypothetical protein
MALPLFMRVTGDGTNLWAGSSITVDDGVNPPEIWDYDTELNLAQASGYDVAENFLAWLNDAGRAWSGVQSWSGPTYEDHTNGGQGKFTLGQSPGTATYTNSTAIQALLGVAAVDAGASDYETEGVVASVAGEWSVTNYLRSNDGQKGAAASVGGWVMTTNATNPIRPGLQAGLDHLQMLALSLAQMYSRAPQEAHAYEEQSDTWRLLSVGILKVDNIGPQLWKVVGTVLG